MCCGTEAGSYLRLIDSCITQLKAQGPSRTCHESKEEEGSTCRKERVDGEGVPREERLHQGAPGRCIPAFHAVRSAR